MKTISFVLFLSLITRFAVAQTDDFRNLRLGAGGRVEMTGAWSSDDMNIITVRQKDLFRLVELRGFVPGQGAWSLEHLAMCPTFRSHIFIRYQQLDRPKAAIIAIYPRGDGKVHLTLLGAGFAQRVEPASVQMSTMRSFNEIWSDERKEPFVKSTISNLDWVGLARCYAEIAGEHLSVNVDVSEGVRSELGAGHDRTTRVLVEVGLDSSKNTSLMVDFDKDGFITHSERSNAVEWKPLP
jgi:hypothetical protein